MLNKFLKFLAIAGGHPVMVFIAPMEIPRLYAYRHITICIHTHIAI